MAGVVSTVIIRRFVFIALILEEATRRTALNEFINEEQTATKMMVCGGGGNAILIRSTLRLKDGHRFNDVLNIRKRPIHWLTLLKNNYFCTIRTLAENDCSS